MSHTPPTHRHTAPFTQDTTRLQRHGLAFFLALISIFTVAKAGERPNIVVILSDDQAWTDYGFMGHPEINTPHLDQLASQSLLMRRGYVASPLCRPSLASILTGQYPSEHGVTGNDMDGRKNRAALDIPLCERFHQHPSFVKALAQAGYLTHQSGKWWEGSYQDGGFTHGMTHGDPNRGGRHGDEGLKIGREGFKPIKDFLDHAQQEQDHPFLLWYAPFLPHTPHNPPARLLQKYQETGRADDEAQYYAMCEWFDETCGELIGELETRNLRDNTVILYICDNGWVPASQTESKENQPKWPAYALRSKTSPYENGIRTPIMVSWPGHITPEDSPDFAHAIDFFPTIASLTGITPPENLLGINLLDAEARAQRDTIYGVCHATHNMDSDEPNATLLYHWCIEGDYKLLKRYSGADTTHYVQTHQWDQAPFHLYNLRDDPQEQHDLAADQPDLVNRLHSKIEHWVATTQTSPTPPTPPTPLDLSTQTDLSAFSTKGNWHLQDGVLALTPRDGEEGWMRYQDYLVTQSSYHDFSCSFEYKLEAEGNSGFFFRIADPAHPVQSGVEVQLLECHDKPELGWHDLGGVIRFETPETGNPRAKATKPAGEWNRVKVTLQGTKLTVVINEIVVQDQLDFAQHPLAGNTSLAPQGRLGFQDHGLPVWIRNLQITPLPSPQGTQ